jgi:hypothetical protein
MTSNDGYVIWQAVLRISDSQRSRFSISRATIALPAAEK